jgi:S1-C subfamily serine protease
MSAASADVGREQQGGARRRRCAMRWMFLALLTPLAAGMPGAPPLSQGITPAAAESPQRWSWLGVRIRDLSEQEMDEISQRHGIREGFGAMIVDVINETPAAGAGIRAGDLVVAFRDRPVVDTRTLQRLVAGARIGETVSVTVLRRGEGRRRLAVSLGPMPEPVVAERVAAEFGFLVRDPDGQPELGGARPASRPAVAAVVRGSRAEAAGLKVGDILIEVNGRPVLTLDATQQALIAASLEAPLPLVVTRGDERVSLLIEQPRVP